MMPLFHCIIKATVSKVAPVDRVGKFLKYLQIQTVSDSNLDRDEKRPDFPSGSFIEIQYRFCVRNSTVVFNFSFITLFLLHIYEFQI